MGEAEWAEHLLEQAKVSQSDELDGMPQTLTIICSIPVKLAYIGLKVQKTDTTIQKLDGSRG